MHLAPYSTLKNNKVTTTKLIPFFTFWRSGGCLRKIWSHVIRMFTIVNALCIWKYEIGMELHVKPKFSMLCAIYLKTIGTILKKKNNDISISKQIIQEIRKFHYQISRGVILVLLIMQSIILNVGLECSPTLRHYKCNLSVVVTTKWVILEQLVNVKQDKCQL